MRVRSFPLAGLAGAARRGAGRVGGVLGHRQGEREPGAAPRPGALRPDAAAVRLHQPLAYRQPQAGAAGPALPLAGRRAGVLAEQVRQPVRRHAPAPVGYRDRHVQAVPRGGDPDRRRLGRVPRRVREQVVEDLHDAPRVGHHPRQVLRQVDAQGVPAAAGEEGASAWSTKAGHLRRFERDRQRARLDAPLVQQIADQAAHLVGLLVDDAEELPRLGQVRSRAKRRARRLPSP